MEICVNYIVMSNGTPENKCVISKKKIKFNVLLSADSVADNR